MTILDFIKAKSLTYAQFGKYYANRATHQAVSNWISKGARPHKKRAQFIERRTNGLVTMPDMGWPQKTS